MSIWWPLTLKIKAGQHTPYTAWLLWHYSVLIPRDVA
jgi:hypothetical protein